MTIWYQIAHAPSADVYRVGAALIVGRERANDAAIVQGVEEITPATLGDVWVVYDPMRGGVVAQYATAHGVEGYEEEDEFLAAETRAKVARLDGLTIDAYCAQHRAQYRPFRGGYERVEAAQ